MPKKNPKTPTIRRIQNSLQRLVPEGCWIASHPTWMTPRLIPAGGRVGKQKIKDTGPLTRKRMETVEDDLLKRSLSFIDKSHAAKKPFFL